MRLPIPLMTAACNAIGGWVCETPATKKSSSDQQPVLANCKVSYKQYPKVSG
jgi:hypothetical protein